MILKKNRQKLYLCIGFFIALLACENYKNLVNGDFNNKIEERAELIEVFSKMTSKTKYYSENIRDTSSHFIEYSYIEYDRISLRFSEIRICDTLQFSSDGIFKNKEKVLSFDPESLYSPYVLNTLVFGTDVIKLIAIDSSRVNKTYLYSLNIVDTNSSGITKLEVCPIQGILSYTYYNGKTRYHMRLDD